MSSTVFYLSGVELFAFYFAQVVWFSQVFALGGLWLHIFHLLRGACGIWLVAKLPNTHDLISGVDLPQNTPFEKLGEIVMDHTKKEFTNYAAQNTKQMKAYVALTLICWFCDQVAFCVGVYTLSVGDAHDSYPGTVLLAFSSVYLALDMYYVVWVISIKLKLPESVSGPVMKMLGGKADRVLGTKLPETKDSAR